MFESVNVSVEESNNWRRLRLIFQDLIVPAMCGVFLYFVDRRRSKGAKRFGSQRSDLAQGGETSIP